MSYRNFCSNCRFTPAVFGSKGCLPYPLSAVMAAGIGLRETRLCSEETFKALWDKATNYILFECMDDEGDPQGCATAKILQRYQCDSDGGFLKLEYLAVQDPYYEHWVTQSGGSASFHHACRKSLSTCQRKVGRKPIVHIQKWTFISESEAEECRKEWKVGRLDAPPPGVARGLKLVRDPAAERTTSSKTKPKRPTRPDSPVEAGEPELDKGSGDDEYASLDEVAEDRERRHRKGHIKRRTSSRRGTSALVPRDPREADRGRRRKEAEKDEDVKASPLDAMLDEDTVPDYVQADSKFEELRKSLEEKKKKVAKDKEGAAAVLAKRVQAGADDSKKRKKKETEKERVTKALKLLTGVKEESHSGSSGAGSDDDEETYLKDNKHGDLMGRQRKLRKLSAEKPGTLLLRGYTLMHEQLGTLHGDPLASGSADEVLKPAAGRYLLTSVLPMMDVAKLGEERLRELRTLCAALDLVVSGKVSMAGDMLMQRLKSILMSLRDGSTAASRYLELIPMDLYPTAASLAESDFARNLAVRNAKSEELLLKVKGSG